METRSEQAKATIRNLVIANKILAAQGVVDAYGHVSARNPDNPETYFLSQSRSPDLVSEDDIMEYDLDSEPINQNGRPMYSERPIHGCLYKSRPDVNSVCHSHAYALVPFSVTDNPIRPIWVMSGAIGAEVPIWDIREEFGLRTNMLVTDNKKGSSLARKLGARTCCMMRGHGAAIATRDLRLTVLVAVSLMLNATMLMQAMSIGKSVNYLTEDEIAGLTDVLTGDRTLGRAWQYWAHTVGFEVGYDPTNLSLNP